MVALAQVSLDDKYELESGRVYLNGTQALTRLLMMQRQRDALAGLNTAGFVSGYRGSPLGALDQTLWRASKFLKRGNIHFQPGLNEELAATSIWGSQQVNLWQGAKYDGVFSMWYGKGPGVDRSGDVMKHANAAGVSKHGGVLVVAGDDHNCKSSTMPHQTEYAFMDWMMPVLHPAGLQEILDLGVFGWELSRYSGCWIGFKTIADNVDSSGSVLIDPERMKIVIPEDFELPADGVHIRWPDKPMEQEYRLQKYKLYAALAFARANRINYTVIDSPKPRFGIISTGKAYLDVLQALEDLGIDERLAAEIGLRVYKVGMVWPLERNGIRDFAEGLEEVLVVEEKRALLENQVKEQLYNWREDVRPRVLGKFDESGAWILPSTSELTPARIARVISNRIARFYTSEKIKDRLAFLEAKEAALARPASSIERLPHYCSGCPHNTSTVVPKGSQALGGIGCHYMATWMDRGTVTFTQMGGEGVPWVGQSAFTETKHMFANLGDGTYFHSGSLAIRAAIAAKVNITYKILYNDAVAMTGGQPLDGVLTVPQMTHQLYGEGVRRIAVVSDEPNKYPDHGLFAKGVSFHHRDELDVLQKELREVAGTSVLIYDQTCAAEKRRRRKRGTMKDPAKRVFINKAVCEGCGDCSVKSNCLSVVPVETEYGRKREIDQSACNKDFSCLKGFCPSFVTIKGGELRKPEPADVITSEGLPQPNLPAAHNPYDIVITGVGGTGVVTIGALLGMAAHLEGKGVSVLDMTGLAQKYGSVISHVRIADQPDSIKAVRITAGNADLLLGCDMLVAAGYDALAKCDTRHAHAVINTHESMTAGFIRDPNLQFPAGEMVKAITDAVGDNKAEFIEGTRLATALLGDSIASNLFMLGYAWQRGLVPLSSEAIEKAIELNGVAIEANKQAFVWGRWCAHDLAKVEKAAGVTSEPQQFSQSLDELLQNRSAYLTAYQNKAYANRYRQLVEKVRDLEMKKAPGRSGLAEAVARYYAKLLAYKDEYEVARLYTDKAFKRSIAAQFAGDYKLEFNLAPPLLAKRDPNSGELKKKTFGPWMLKAFSVLAKCKGLRGGALDVFGYTAERKSERQLILGYENTLARILQGLNQDNYETAVALASLPEEIRGYGHVKEHNINSSKQREQELWVVFENPQTSKAAA